MMMDHWLLSQVENSLQVGGLWSEVEGVEENTHK